MLIIWLQETELMNTRSRIIINRASGKMKERQIYASQHAFCWCLSRAHQRQHPRALGSTHLASFFDHDVVTVSVTNSEDIRSYTVASTGQSELLNGSVQVIPEQRKQKTKVRWNSNHLYFLVNCEESCKKYLNRTCCWAPADASQGQGPEGSGWLTASRPLPWLRPAPQCVRDRHGTGDRELSLLIA